MAINKRKVLAAAQKYLQKGQLDKALKEFRTALDADPRDANLRLKVGDVLLRQGSRDEAIATYLKVAQQFAKDGFDAKAVAIYKQITKIDEKRFDAYVPLAELYQRLGLNSEALASLQTAADGLRREGRKRQALDLLRKMAALDPTNTTSRLKIADVLRQEGLADDAIAEYEGVAEECARQGDVEGAIAAIERVLEVEPERTESQKRLARMLVEHGDPGRAEPWARRAAEAESELPESYELLAEIYTALRREVALEQTYRRLAEVYRARGDEEKARDILQRFVSPEPFQAGAAEPDLGAGAGFEAGAPTDHPDVLEDSDALEPDLGAGPTLGGKPGEGALSDEPEQILAEANVYLRYGKHERAIASLELILHNDPDHRVALEKLGEAHVAAGAPDRAVEVWSRAAEVARVRGDASGHEALRDRIAALDADAAGAFDAGAAPPPAASDAAVPADADSGGASAGDLTGDAQADSDAAVPVDAGADFAADAEGTDETPGAEAADDLDDDLDIEIDVDGEGEPDAAAAAEKPDGEAPPHPTSDGVGSDEKSEGSESGSAGLDSSAMTRRRIAEDLEEADFYFHQGLYDEAEGIYQRVLSLAPHQPQALLRIGEIADARGGDPGATGSRTALPAASTPKPVTRDGGDEPAPAEAGAAPAEADDADIEIDIDADFGDESELDEGAAAEAEPSAAEARAPDAARAGGAVDDRPADAAPDAEPSDAAMPVPDAGAAGAAPEPADAAPAAEDAEFDRAAGPDAAEAAGGEGGALEDPGDWADELVGEAPGADADDATPVEPAAVPTTQEAVGDEDSTDSMLDSATGRELQDLIAELSRDEPSAQPAAPEAEAASRAPGEADFDLAEELSDVLAGDGRAPAAGAAATAEDGFEAIFRDFKRGVSQTLGEGDLDTHYDLGIAYREMGLFEDALGEFRLTLASSSRRLDSLHMLGLCALDLGRPQDAVAHLEQALTEPGMAEEQRTALRFDLGRAYEERGDATRARSMYELVAATDDGFRDVAERLARLGDASDGDATPDEVETFASFDDVIAEAEAALGQEGEAPAASAEPPAPAGSEPEPEPEPQPVSDEFPTGEGEAEAPLAAVEVVAETEVESLAEPAEPPIEAPEPAGARAEPAHEEVVESPGAAEPAAPAAAPEPAGPTADADRGGDAGARPAAETDTESGRDAPPDTPAPSGKRRKKISFV